MWQKQKEEESEGAFKGPTFSGQCLQSSRHLSHCQSAKKREKINLRWPSKGSIGQAAFYKAVRSFSDEE